MITVVTKQLFYIVIIFHNITVFYFILLINVALVSIRDFFQKHNKKKKNLLTPNFSKSDFNNITHICK